MDNDKPGSITINRGEKVGRPIAGYVSAKDGSSYREDYATAAAARADARALSRRTGWPISEDLGRVREHEARQAMKPARERRR